MSRARIPSLIPNGVIRGFQESGGGQRTESNYRKSPRASALIHQVDRQSRPDTRRGRRHRPYTLLLYDELFLGIEDELDDWPRDSEIDNSGSSIFLHWHAWRTADFTLSEGFPEIRSWKIDTRPSFIHVDWSDSGPVSTPIGANVIDDLIRTQREPASERYIQPTRWRDTSTSAGNHITLRSVAVPGRMSPAPQGWHERQHFLSGLTMTEGYRIHVGPATSRSSYLDFLAIPISSRIPKNDSSTREHYRFLIRSHTRDVHRQSTRPSITRRDTALRQMKSIVRYEKSHRVTKTFHEYPERLQKNLSRAEAVFVDAMLGRLWEEVGSPNAHLWDDVFFADFFAGQGETGRAVRNADFVGVVSKFKWRCLSWVSTSTRETMSQSRKSVDSFVRSPCGILSKAPSTTSRTSIDPWRTDSFRQSFSMTTGAHRRRWYCPSDWSIVRLCGLWNTLRSVCCGRLLKNRALKHLSHVFMIHLHLCQFGSLSRQASTIILGHVDPHH